MFHVMRTKRRIKKLRKAITLVEKKRSRSQAALVEAILTNTTPEDEDVDYFNKYTEQINSLRDTMHELQISLNGK